MFHKLVLFCLVLVLAGCQGSGLPTPTPTNTPTLEPTLTPTPFPEDFTGEAKVGDFMIKIKCQGSGEPTIILENTTDYISWKTPLFSDISRTCIYSRAGMALFDEEVIGPRTTLDQVKDLHELLTKTGIPGPYILVGIYLAGFNLMVYTDQYPDEVVGLVCLQCAHPMMFEIFREKLREKFANEPDVEAKINNILNERDFGEFLGTDPEAWQNWTEEKLDIFQSVPQVLKLNSLGDRPFIVLVIEESSTSLDDLSKLQLESWIETQNKLSQMSTQGRVEFVPGTDIFRIVNNDAVNKAIQEVYDKVTAP